MVPVPENVTEMKRFLGLCSYYKNFIPIYGDIAKPLRNLTRKGYEFCWTTECSNAFDVLKGKLTIAPVLAYPNQTDTFLLDTDALNFAISGVLSQIQDGRERVIAYGSKVLNKSERNYCTTRREWLAIVYTVKYCRRFLLAKKFLLRTDYSALRWMFNFKHRMVSVLDGCRPFRNISLRLIVGRVLSMTMPTHCLGFLVVSVANV